MKPNRLLSKLKVCYYILTSKEVNENMTDSVKGVINSGPLWDICIRSSYVIQRMIEVGLCEAYQLGLANGYALWNDRNNKK